MESLENERAKIKVDTQIKACIRVNRNRVDSFILLRERAKQSYLQMSNKPRQIIDYQSRKDEVVWYSCRQAVQSI